MAKVVTEQLVDDLDGTTAAETVAYGLDGTTYEIDLSEVNAKELRAFLERYIEKSRTKGRSIKASDAAAIREWARGRKIEVPDRGRIPGPVREQYEAAAKKKT